MIVHPQFDPIALTLGPVAVRWYGLMYLAGFVVGLMLGRHRARTRPDLGWSLKDVDDLLFYAVIGVVLGGRLGYVLFYKFADYLQEPLRVLYVWEGGMSFHGGFLGVIIAMAWFARRRRLSWLAVTDFIAPLTPAGLGFGRIGNFINAELWGRPTDVPWAVVFPNVDALARHHTDRRRTERGHRFPDGGQRGRRRHPTHPARACAGPIQRAEVPGCQEISAHCLQHRDDQQDLGGIPAGRHPGDPRHDAAADRRRACRGPR